MDQIKTRAQLHRFNSNKETIATIEKPKLALRGPQISLPPLSSSSVWNTSTLGYQHSKTNCADNLSKGIITQMAPEEFSIEDVRQLQRFVRELHVENMQKSVAYIQLEHAYHSLKDEVAALTKHGVAKGRNEGSDFRNDETPTNPADDLPDRRELFKELNMYKEKCVAMQCEESNLRKLVDACEERFQHFESMITDSSSILTENKKLLDNTMLKVEVLESELAIWKERTQDYEKLLQEKNKGSLDETQTIVHNLKIVPAQTDKYLVQCSTDLDEDTGVHSEHGPRQNDRKSFTGNSVYKYLAPKANSCFSSVKATLCRCPLAPVQDNIIKKPAGIDGKT